MARVKVLYVEDELFLGKIVRESLESRDYEVVMVSHGNEVLKAFEKHTFDICILDIMLPGKDGLSLAKEIRLLNPEIPIIFLTAKIQTEDLVSGFKAGGNDYIRKPFSMEELIARMQNLLRLKSSRESVDGNSVHQISTFNFYPAIMELRQQDQLIKLSHKENELLKLLVINRHKSIERAMILQEIWGDDHFFNSRNLDVYITRLRGYFKADPDIQIITLKGIGYRFVY